MASLVVVLGLRRWLPLVPGSLVVVALGILSVSLFGLEAHGVAIVGRIDPGLPQLGLPGVPELGDYLQLAGPAVGVLLLGYAEGLGAAKTYAAKAGYDIDPNRELLGLGGANLGAGLASGMVVNGSLSKTAVNGAAGARTQLSGLVVAVLTAITLLFLTGLFEQLPEATLAAVVIAAVIELVDIGALRRLYGAWTERLGTIYGRAARAEFAAALAALLGVLIFDTLPGLFIGIGVSLLLLLLYRASRPNVAVLGRVPGRPGQWADTAAHPENRQSPGVVAARLRELAGTDGVRAVVLDAETVPFVDVTAADMLATVAAGLHRRGVVLLLARDIGQVRDVLRTAGPDTAALVVHPTVDDAVAAALHAGSEGDPR